VAYGDPVPDVDRVKVALTVENGTVLDVGVCPYPDRVNIPAKYGVHPYGGVLAKSYVSQDLGGKINITTGGNFGRMALITTNHFHHPPDSTSFAVGSLKEKRPVAARAASLQGKNEPKVMQKAAVYFLPGAESWSFVYP